LNAATPLPSKCQRYKREQTAAEMEAINHAEDDRNHIDIHFQFCNLKKGISISDIFIS